jgi:hypothetical protein
MVDVKKWVFCEKHFVLHEKFGMRIRPILHGFILSLSVLFYIVSFMW